MGTAASSAMGLRAALFPRWRLAWFAPLLLPVLPLLSLIAHASRLEEGWRPLLILALGGVGVGLSLVVPVVGRSRGARVAKEIEQLHPVWLVALFLPQVPLFFEPEAGALALVLFGAVAALLGSATFGVEYNQRAMGSLLSLPVSRESTWNLKLGLLGGALLTQALVFVLTVVALAPDNGGSSNETFRQSLQLLAWVPVLAWVAWGSAPWWTLLTRNQVAALVFTITLPLLPLMVLSFTADLLLAYRNPALLEPDEPVWLDWIIPAGMAVFLVTIGGVGLLAQRRRWFRLEAQDAGPGDHAGIFLTGRATRTAGAARRHPPLALLLGKELRLQAVTFGLLTLGFALATGRAWGFTEALTTREFLTGCTVLCSVVSILLAGACSIAEERRLGTLDSQLLLPVARSTQFALKLLVALVPAVLAAVTILWVNDSLQLPRRADDLPGAGMFVGVMLALFLFPLHTSSASSNALRALLVGLGTAAGTVVAAGFLISVSLQVSRHLVADDWSQVLSRLPQAMAQARTMAPEVIDRLSGSMVDRESIARQALTVAMLGALLPAGWVLYRTWRNFSRPAVAALRLGRDYAVTLAALLVVMLLATAWMGIANERQQRAERLLFAWNIAQTYDRLPAGQQRLWEETRSPYGGMSVDIFIQTHSINGMTQVRVPLPFGTRQRETLIHSGALPPALRDGLIADRPADFVPEAAPADPRLYREDLMDLGFHPAHPGFLKQVDSRPGGAATIGGGAATNQPPQRSVLPPALARRYGLRVQEPDPPATASNAPVSPSP